MNGSCKSGKGDRAVTLTLAAASLAAVLTAGTATLSFADGPDRRANRPDSLGPIGVMVDHMHMADKVMFSYRYSRMEMRSSRNQTNNLSTAEVLQRFPVAPLNMTTEMHVFGVMYAPTKWMTVMLMAPYLEKEMDHVTRTGVRFTTESSGIGDTEFTAVVPIYSDTVHDMHLGIGVRFPTGSIGERDDTPAQLNAVLPYPMQFGSGTFDFRNAITYTGFLDRGSWGGQFLNLLRLGRNSEGYALGDDYLLTGWGSIKWTNLVSTSVRFTARKWGNIDGRDIRLNPDEVQTANPGLQAGTRLDVGLGINVLFPESTGPLAGHRIGLELGFPAYQKLDGPQLESDWFFTVGWQKTF